MHRPVRHAQNVICPILLIAPTHDNICYVAGAQEFAHKCDSAELLELDCGKLPYPLILYLIGYNHAFAGHFDIYPGAAFHEQSLEAELEFLKRVVPI